VESYGWYDTDESIFITMEYMKNGDLRRFLDKPLLEPDVLDIIAQITEGLSLMHVNKFAHRDLKPAVSLRIP
jgi:serine/threonine protein kinase